MAEERYVKPEDAYMRLDGSVVKYKDDYYYACSARDTFKLTLYDLPTKKEKLVINPNSPDLDVRSVPLGYMNDRPDRALFIYRVPFRKQKQGISPENIMCIHDYTPGAELSIGQGAIFSLSFYKMLKNDYPDFEELLKTNLTGKSSFNQAFSRDFSLGYAGGGKDSLDLFFKAIKVGTINKKSGMAEILPVFNNSVIILKLASYGVSVA